MIQPYVHTYLGLIIHTYTYIATHIINTNINTYTHILRQFRIFISYIHIHTPKNILIHIHIFFIHAFVHTYMHTYTHVCNTSIYKYLIRGISKHDIQTKTYVHIKLHIKPDMCVRTRMYICKYFNTLVYVYSFTQKHTYVHSYTKVEIYTHAHKRICKSTHKFIYSYTPIHTKLLGWGSYKDLARSQCKHN